MSNLKRFAMAVVVTVEAPDADTAYEIVAHADMTARDNPSLAIECEYSTNAYPVPADHDSRETFWEIPELLWGDGRINVLNPPRTIRG